VTYGNDGDGLVDNNNALTTMASALKIFLRFGMKDIIARLSAELEITEGC
jgi:hypothetical protein